MLGIGELSQGDDLAAVIAEHAPPLQDGDVLIVTSKVVSKTEGRMVVLDTADPDAREAARQQAIEAETVRVVAARDDLRIVETRHGLVLAAAGVDASNVSRNELALLPLDPDFSAQLLREGIRERLGVDVGVVISDSMGRPVAGRHHRRGHRRGRADRADRSARAHRRLRQRPRGHPGRRRRRTRRRR